MDELLGVVLFSSSYVFLQTEGWLQMDRIVGGVVALFVLFILLYKIGGMIALLGFYIKEFAQWLNNNRQPILSVPVSAITKRSVRGMVRTFYFTTFKTESGERMELEVNEKDYGLIEEGSQGTMTYRGTRYKRFQPS